MKKKSVRKYSRKKTVPKRSWVRWLLLRLVLIGAILVFFGIAYFGWRAHQYDLDSIGRMPERSIVYDCKEREIGTLHGENRIVVGLDKVSSHFVNALIAREDRRFKTHNGIDFRGLSRAMLRNLKELRFVQGASTLTMQLARNRYELREKSILRKAIEMMLARRIEARYDKSEILAHYVNIIYLGSGLYGVERASQSYFGKSANDLSLGEAAMLVGIIRSPSRFSPRNNLKAATRERNHVLRQMFGQDMITEAQMDTEKRLLLSLVAKRDTVQETSWALDAVRRELNTFLDKNQVREGGLRIYTTLDLDLQKQAEKVLEQRLSAIEKKSEFSSRKHQTKAVFAKIKAKNRKATPQYLQGAIVAIDNRSGGVLAIVGGRDIQHSQFNRAILAKRQVGSIFKPFVYTVAFDRGIMPGTLIDDGPIYPGELPSLTKPWSPANSDGTHRGWQPAAFGLVKSRNTMSVRVGKHAGIEPILQLAKRLGMGSKLPRTPSVYIGAFENNLQNMTAAYTTFPNNGQYSRPYLISALTNSSGAIIYSSTPLRSPTNDLIGSGTGAFQLSTQVLQDVMDQSRGGTGAAARRMGFSAQAGGKTGTTDGYRDAWFIGFTSRVTCGVWVGFDRPKTIINRGYGSTIALPIWTDLMLAAQRDYLPQRFSSPQPYTTILLCAQSALRATEGCKRHHLAYNERIPESMVPMQYCHIHPNTQLQQQPNKKKRRGIWNALKNIF